MSYDRSSDQVMFKYYSNIFEYIRADYHLDRNESFRLILFCVSLLEYHFQCKYFRLHILFSFFSIWLNNPKYTSEHMSKSVRLEKWTCLEISIEMVHKIESFSSKATESMGDKTKYVQIAWIPSNYCSKDETYSPVGFFHFHLLVLLKVAKTFPIPTFKMRSSTPALKGWTSLA